MEKAVVLCPAKVNLFLNILGKENNRHQVKMINQSVDLYDYLTILPNPYGTIEITSNNENVPLNDENSCFVAASLMQEYYNLQEGFSIHIDKHIPIGAGLGGESTDAAGVIIAINQMFDLGLSNADMASVGSEVGSDVPFCVYGGIRIVKGNGNIISTYTNPPKHELLIVSPNFQIDTKAAFEEFDKSTFEYKEIDWNLGFNDLQIVAPDIVQDLQDFLADNGSCFAGMTGSGPSLIAGFQTKEQRLKALKALRKEFDDIQTFEVNPCDGVNVLLKKQLN